MKTHFKFKLPIKEYYYYSARSRCPETKLPLSENEIMYSKGVCPACGHVDDSTITHYEKYSVKVNIKKLFGITISKEIEENAKED